MMASTWCLYASHLLTYSFNVHAMAVLDANLFLGLSVCCLGRTLICVYHCIVFQALDRAKPDKEKAKKTGQSRSFKRLVCLELLNPNDFS